MSRYGPNNKDKTVKMLLRTNAIVALSLAAVASTAKAFSIGSPKRTTALTPRTTRFMAEDEGDSTTFVKSVLKKEIAYDEKTGRFFETGFDEGECIPDEEFCMTDKDSGEVIRLTVEEKERIFMDALQVSSTRRDHDVV